MSDHSCYGCVIQAILIIVASIAWGSIENGDGGALAIITLVAISILFFLGWLFDDSDTGPGSGESGFDDE